MCVGAILYCIARAISVTYRGKIYKEESIW